MSRAPNADAIRRMLIGPASALTIDCRDCVTSTNTLLREAADEGAAEGLVLIASEQSAGRGRLGRSFHSPAGTGLYLSLLLRPKLGFKHSVKITTAASVAMCGALEAVSGMTAQIKWVNDILLGGLKVCGILTEASLKPGTAELDYAILGAGVNISPPEGGFPDELADIAGAVLPEPAAQARELVAAEFLNRFMPLYSALPGTDYAEEYIRRSAVIGREINVITPSGTRAALALGMDEDFGLIVRWDNGRTETLNSGEISIRLQHSDRRQ